MTILTVALIDRPLATYMHETFGGSRLFAWPFPFVDAVLGISLIYLFVTGSRYLANRILPPNQLPFFFAAWAVVWTEAAGVALKRVAGRTWPDASMKGDFPSYITDGTYQFAPFHGGPGWEAFPSGNAAMIAVLATAFCLTLRTERMRCVTA